MNLSYRAAMSDLIETTEQLPPPPQVVYVDLSEDAPGYFDLLAGDDDLDLMQNEEEERFMVEMNIGREHRALHHFNHSY